MPTKSWTPLLLIALSAACEAQPQDEAEGPDDVVLNASELHASCKAQVRQRTLNVKGTGAADRIALRLQSPTRLAVDFGDDGSADAVFSRATFDRIHVDAGNGDDLVRMDESGGTFTDTTAVTILGGKGNDTLLGGVGAETFLAGPGKDTGAGGRGNDVAFLGSGDDAFVWDPGDGSDVVEGDIGTDALVFNGSAVAEQIDLSANGGRLRFFRNIANITMDTDD